MFEKIYGNAKTVDNLKNSIVNNRVAHCYLFSGAKGLGKRTLAKEFAKALMCESESERPCCKCKACIQVENDSHLDVLYVGHEKPTTFGVDDVRTGINQNILIRPNSSDKKIYIIDDAELLNAQAQNAMLKTIEEPPSYAIIMLLSDNKEMFLPTVLSRCVEFSMVPVKDSEVVAALRSRNLYEEATKEFVTDFARGNIGRAIRLLTDEAYRDKVSTLDDCLRRLPDMNIYNIKESVASLGTQKEDMELYLSRMQVYFGELLKKKALGSDPVADLYDYSDFPRVFEQIQLFRTRLSVNVNTELSLMLLLEGMRPGTLRKG